MQFYLFIIQAGIVFGGIISYLLKAYGIEVAALTVLLMIACLLLGAIMSLQVRLNELKRESSR